MKLLVINGPNLNMLGLREPDIYGSGTYAALVELIHAAAKEAGADVLLFGHTHRPHEEYLSEEGLYLCNPGSIGRPSSGDPSFSILDILPNGSVCLSHGNIPLFSRGK